MPSFESPSPSPQPEQKKTVAEAFLEAAKKMRQEAPTVQEQASTPSEQDFDNAPLGKFVAPIELKPGEKSSPGVMPEELASIDEGDIEEMLGDIKAGDIEQKPAERSEKEIVTERRIATENTAYAKMKENVNRLRSETADEDAAVLELYRNRLGLAVNKPIPKGQKFAFTPYEQRKLREMQEAARANEEQQPPTQAA